MRPTITKPREEGSIPSIPAHQISAGSPMEELDENPLPASKWHSFLFED